MRITEVDNPVTQADIDQLEVFADRLFAKVGIDVEFTRHFLDRVNDERNVKQITMSELTRLFKQEYKRWGKPIARLGPDAEAVMKDMATNINLPFALRWDHKNNELDLIAKTVMRKANFTTSNQEFAVEDGFKSMFRPSAYELAAERLHSVLQRKEKENGGVFRHALGWYAAKIASGFRDIDSRELIAYYQKNFDAVLSESDLPYITEEAAPKLDYDQLRIKIPANDNAKPIKGEVIDLNARRAAAKEALSKMSDAEKKAANEFIKKNKTLLQRLSAVGARSSARHGVATLSSAVTGPLAPAVATVLNVTLLGWDLADAGIEIWKWATSPDAKDIKQGNAKQDFGTDLAIEVPGSPRQNSKDDDAYDIKHLTQQVEFGPVGMRAQAAQLLAQRQAEYRRDQKEWEKEFGQTHLDNGTANPAAGYQDKILRIAQAEIQKTARDTRGSDSDFANQDVKSKEKAPTVSFQNVPPLEVPTFDPEVEIPTPSKDKEIDKTDPKRITPPEKGDPFVEPELPVEPTPKGPKVDTTSPEELPDPNIDFKDPEVPGPTTDPKVDPTVPKRITQPSREEPFKEPEPPVGPTVNPEYIPTQPKNPKQDPDNPEVPDSTPSDQPDIEIPQPLNAPQKDIPFIPPANLTDPEIAFQDNPARDNSVPVATVPPTDGTGGKNNNNKKQKKRRKWDRGGSSDYDYTDPLQRWQRKYGMWDQ